VEVEENCSSFHQHFFTNSFCADILSPKKLQSQTVSREKLQKTLSYQKAAHKVLVKLTPANGSVTRWMMIQGMKP